MKTFTKLFMAVCFMACLFVLLPTAAADDFNKKTTVTFSNPVEVPGVGAQVLPAGTYVFKLLDSDSNRHIVQIFNADMTHVYTTILAVPNYRIKATDKTVMTFKERAAGEPEAIRAWFYPGRQWGEEFVYSKPKALALAKEVNQPVLYTPVEIASIEDLKVAPIEAVKPTGELVPLTEVVQAPPAEVAKVGKPVLPKTGSLTPLLGLIGFLSVGAAGVMRKYSA
jgi:LPXTG-motif cell wall-anchored protein